MSLWIDDVKDELGYIMGKLRRLDHHYDEARSLINLLEKVISADYERSSSYEDPYEWESEYHFGKFGETSKWGTKRYNVYAYEVDGRVDDVNIHAYVLTKYLQGYPHREDEYSAQAYLYYNDNGEFVKFEISDGSVNAIVRL